MPSTTDPLHAIASTLVLLDEQGDSGRVTIARLGVGVTSSLTRNDARFIAAMATDLVIEATLRLFGEEATRPIGRARACAERVVQVVDAPGGRAAVLIGGRDLVGQEPALVAADRARAMRETIVAELERALGDEQPETVRRHDSALEGR